MPSSLSLASLIFDARNVEPRLATVVGVDLDAREVHLDRGDPVPYDTLVLALGAVVLLALRIVSARLVRTGKARGA